MDEKELQEKAYDAVELAKTSGKIRKGTNEVTKAVEKGSAKLVVVAKDANPPEITMHLAPLSKEKGIPLVEVPSKEELGAAAGLPVATVGVAIVEEGNSKAAIKSIADALSK